MTNLSKFLITPTFVKRFPIFVETGTGDGEGTEYAARHPFEQLWSIDCHPKCYFKASRKFKEDSRVELLLGSSRLWLDRVLSKEETNLPIFFYLDAYLPTFNCEGEIKFPLIEELSTIRRIRPDGYYCILINELRFYEDGDWEEGNIDGELRNSVLDSIYSWNRSLNFLEVFRETHSIEVLKKGNGFAMIKPYGTPDLIHKELM